MYSRSNINWISFDFSVATLSSLPIHWQNIQKFQLLLSGPILLIIWYWFLNRNSNENQTLLTISESYLFIKDERSNWLFADLIELLYLSLFPISSRLSHPRSVEFVTLSNCKGNLVQFGQPVFTTSCPICSPPCLLYALVRFIESNQLVCNVRKENNYNYDVILSTVGETGEWVETATIGLVLAPQSRVGQRFGVTAGFIGWEISEDSWGAVARLRSLVISTYALVVGEPTWREGYTYPHNNHRFHLDQT